jgi:sterol 3beta-glucosyltransferase
VEVIRDKVMRDKGLICLSAGLFGTAGDIRPLVALALALRQRGFEIRVLGDVAFERMALRAGLAAEEWFNCCEVPQTFWLRTMAGQRGPWGLRRRYRDRWLERELMNHTAQRVELFWRKVGGPTNPRIVAAIGSIAAVRTLWTFGPQCAQIVSCPMPFQPSAHVTLAPPDLSPVGRLREWIKRKNFKRTLQKRFCEDMFHLVSASPAVFPRPIDWLPNMQVTGYITLEDERRNWSPPLELTAFLQQGPPPVYVGFGSFAFLFGARGEQLAREIIEGCRLQGIRCIIQSPDLPSTLASDRAFILNDDVPHAWLFPRCAAIVHHGGYGTMHSALVAQRPTIIYPVHTDQFLWAARMGDLGIGPGFTARLPHLTSSRLRDDLAFVLRPSCAANAARVGTAVSTDRGLDVQVAAIESIVEHTQRGLAPTQWQMPALETREDFTATSRQHFGAGREGFAATAGRLQ